jgi:hypothetical protein
MSEDAARNTLHIPDGISFIIDKLITNFMSKVKASKNM